MPEKELERNAMKLAQLRERLRNWNWLPGCANNSSSSSSSTPRGSANPQADTKNGKSQSWRRAHVGSLLAHVDVLYDLMEGLPAAFVWKIRTAAQKEKQAKAPQFPWNNLWPAAASMPSKAAGDENAAPQLLLSKCTVALSSDLTHVEVHHAHEVNVVPLTHVSEVCGGPLDGGPGPLDEWCAVLRLVDGHHLSLRFFKRRQVGPFVAVVLALLKLQREAASEDNDAGDNTRRGADTDPGADGVDSAEFSQRDSEAAPLLNDEPAGITSTCLKQYTLSRKEWV